MVCFLPNSRPNRFTRARSVVSAGKWNPVSPGWERLGQFGQVNGLLEKNNATTIPTRQSICALFQ